MPNKKKGYPIKDLIQMFDLHVANPKESTTDRLTDSPSIHRTGLELAGAYDIKHTATNIIGWGTKEEEYLSKFSHDEVLDKLNTVLTKETPMIMLSNSVSEKSIKVIIEVANRYQIPVISTQQHLSTLRATIGAELVEYFAREDSVHGSLVIVDGVGVMVIGKSGVGKSEAVLELIQKGHAFISDDTVVIKQMGSKFTGTGVPLTRGLLEARGIGLINIPHIYGSRAIRHSTHIELVVELVAQAKGKEFDRLGINELKYKVLDGEIPLMQIPVDSGRSIASLIEAATNVFSDRKEGVDSLTLMNERRENNE